MIGEEEERRVGGGEVLSINSSFMNHWVVVFG